MFQIIVAFGPTNLQWAFTFDTQERAEEQLTSLRDGQGNREIDCGISDDYGQIANWVGSEIHGILFRDMDYADMATNAIARRKQELAAEKKKAQSEPLIQKPAPVFMGNIPR